MEQIKKLYREGNLEVIETTNEYKVVEHDGHRYKIYGESRLRVVEIPMPKIAKFLKAKKTEKVYVESKVCEDCGSEFQVSKFNQYFTKCPDCRKSRKSKEDQEVKCDCCGNLFLRSKFAPNQMTCSDCTIRLNQQKKDKVKFQSLVDFGCSIKSELKSEIEGFVSKKKEDGAFPSKHMIEVFIASLS